MTLQTLLEKWNRDPDTVPNISTWRQLPARPARMEHFPADLPLRLVEALQKKNIHQLYSHQAETWRAIELGENVVVATSTASGKTLAFQLPVLSAMLKDPTARAIFLYPTKALAQDQLASLADWINLISQDSDEQDRIKAAIYDGDTPTSHRKSIREQAGILLTNPDMLHMGILPHHTNWEEFFRGLQFIVLDELHTYRGVFGSHVANVIRRLKRIAAFYGSDPQFILTSATIGNPAGLAENLVESHGDFGGPGWLWPGGTSFPDLQSSRGGPGSWSAQVCHYGRCAPGAGPVHAQIAKRGFRPHPPRGGGPAALSAGTDPQHHSGTTMLA